ncbi:MAG: glycosyltransferase family 9 protein [Blastocatellia bacterium]
MFSDPSNPPRTILVTHIAGLGETTLALPALRSLRQAFPRAHITVAASAAGAEIIRLAECANETLVVGRLRRAEFIHPGALYRSVQSLREAARQSYELAIELQRNTEGAVLLNFANPGRRPGMTTRGQTLRGALERLSAALGRGRGEKHHAQQYLEILQPLGVRPVEAAPRITTSREADVRVDKLLDKGGWRPGELLAGLHPGAGAAHKRWPVDRFAELAARFVHNLGARVVIFSGPGERALARQITAALPKGSAILLARPAMDDFVSALARLSAFAGNLSGPAHLAAATGAPVAVISGHDQATPYDVLGAGVRHVRGPRPEHISVEEVYETACSMIQSSRTERLGWR